jgi:hypothetical protein
VNGYQKHRRTRISANCQRAAGRYGLRAKAQYLSALTHPSTIPSFHHSIIPAFPAIPSFQYSILPLFQPLSHHSNIPFFHYSSLETMSEFFTPPLTKHPARPKYLYILTGYSHGTSFACDKKQNTFCS